MITAQEAVRYLLLENDTIQQYIAVPGETRIYPNIAPEFTASDNVEQYIVYEVISRIRSRDLRGPDRLAQTRVQVDVYARDYKIAHIIAAAVGSATDGWRGIVVHDTDSLDVASIELDSTEDLYEESQDSRETAWYRVSIDLLVWHEMYTPAVARK